MRILLDQGTPAPLREHLPGHEIKTAYEMGWSQLENGDLLAAAEAQFELMISTDQNLRYQQNLAGRRIAILILMTTSWPRIEAEVQSVQNEVSAITAGDYREINFP